MRDMLDVYVGKLGRFFILLAAVLAGISKIELFFCCAC